MAEPFIGQVIMTGFNFAPLSYDQCDGQLLLIAQNTALFSLVGKTLHVCCGKSMLGDVRLDIDPKNAPEIVADAARLPFHTWSFDTVLCDPPYNGKFQWNHDLLSELCRIARRRIVFQHWFIPANKDGQYKKAHSFQLSETYVWQPQTYFGRAQIISVFDYQALPLFAEINT